VVWAGWGGAGGGDCGGDDCEGTGCGGAGEGGGGEGVGSAMRTWIASVFGRLGSDVKVLAGWPIECWAEVAGLVDLVQREVTQCCDFR